MDYLKVVQEGVIVLDVVGGLDVLGEALVEDAQDKVLVDADVLLVFWAYLSFNSKVFLYLELKFDD